MYLCSLSSDLLSDGLGIRSGAWSRDGSSDDLDPIWSHDLPTVTWSRTSRVTTLVRDSKGKLTIGCKCGIGICVLYSSTSI